MGALKIISQTLNLGKANNTQINKKEKSACTVDMLPPRRCYLIFFSIILRHAEARTSENEI